MLLFVTVGAYRDQRYNLNSKYEGSDLFKRMRFLYRKGSDCTHGYVTYVNESAAKASRLINTNVYGLAYMGVDHSVALDPAGPGRKSVRISSQKSWTHGLFLADISHMPGGIRGPGRLFGYSVRIGPTMGR
ncbi:hypothetical protein DID88_005213 [Monilinia fructigena]|uniref:Uncharacterized protein n=1 Tax=Monilinia fructigena TaxID=38457 RepID=A0A395IDU9_9HELO|nr:hypothetical protein DID88_005213 [Monilinia fructigena]